MKRGLIVAGLLVAAVVVLGLAAPELWRADSTHEAPPRATPRGERVDESAEAPEEAKSETAPDLPAPVDLASVDRDRDLHGIVVDKKTGEPVAGAELAVVKYPWRRSTLLNMDDYDATVAGPTTKSAVDGTFRLTLRRGELVALRAHAEGYVRLELAKRQAGERVTVALERGVRVLVIVREPGGAPAAGAGVKLRRRGHFTLSGATGGDGVCTFDAVPGGIDVRLEVTPVRFARPRAWHKDHALPMSGEHTLEAQLEDGRTIRGRVTDADTNEPLAGVRIGRGWVGHRPVLTDADGRYEMPYWSGREGWREISAQVEGYGEARTRVDNREVIDFALIPGASVKGRVVATGGGPVAGVLVGAVGSEREQLTRRYAVTDATGRFLLTGLRRDMQITLTLLKPGFGRYLTDFRPTATVDLGDLTMPPAQAIEGTVRGGKGAPLARVEVILRGANADRYRLVGGKNRVGYFFYGDAEERVTDDLGRFRFPDLAPGTYTLKVRLKGAPEHQQTVELPAGEERVEANVRLEGLRRFTVHVHDETGAPVRAYVSMRPARGKYAAAHTDRNGAAVFFVAGSIETIGAPSPETGAYLRAEALRDISAEQSEVRFVLRRGMWIKGRVECEGKPLFRAFLHAMQDGKQVATGYSNDTSGEFGIVVPQGAVVDLVLKSVSKRMPGGPGFQSDELTYAGELEGVAAGAEDVVVPVRKVERDRTLRVRVVRPDGTPAEGVIAYGGGTRGAKTDANGVVMLTGLPAKPIRVVLGLVPEGLVAPESEPVDPNGQDFVVKLLDGVARHGVVELPDGKPAARVYVMGVVGKTYLRAMTDRDGRFTLYLPPGLKKPIQVMVTGSVKGTTYTGAVDGVEPNGTAEIRIKLVKR